MKIDYMIRNLMKFYLINMMIENYQFFLKLRSTAREFTRKGNIMIIGHIDRTCD